MNWQPNHHHFPSLMMLGEPFVMPWLTTLAMKPQKGWQTEMAWWATAASWKEEDLFWRCLSL